MELQVIINQKKGVINITSEQFIIEDLKAHVCAKLNLNENDFKVKVACGNSPSIELVKVPSFSFNQKETKDNKVKYSKLEKEAITQLRNKWNGKAMDCDYDINEEHPSLDKKLYESYNLSNRFRRVFKWFMENNKDYFFVCLDNTSVYLKINKENKEIFLFDGASEESVNQFMKRGV